MMAFKKEVGTRDRMKKECERTRKAFPRYLRGHVFRTERTRIERHLAACVICKSEFEGLRRADETRRILKDIAVTDGFAPFLKDSIASLGKLKKVFYRPLWLIAIALIAGGVYYYVVTPRQLDLEIEKIVKTTPDAPPVEQKPRTETAVATAPAVSTPPPAPSAEASTAPAPSPAEVLIVHIIPDDKTAVRRINEIIRGQLRIKKFTDTEREVSGRFLPEKLETFFGKVEAVARLKFNRTRFESFPNDQPIPVVFKLDAVSKSGEKQASSAKTANGAPKPGPAPAVAPVARPTTSVPH